MNYQEFNKNVLDFYLNRTASKFINLSIDEYDFDKIYPISKISDILPSRNWEKLLEERETIPMYFGLLALQCLAAFNMEEDEFNAADAYQIRLKSILKIESDNELQVLFKGNNLLKPIQEEIWYEAKKYLLEDHKLILEIPERKNNAGRYVQYPKSQSLLNSEDLKYFTVYFSQEFGVKESIDYSYFVFRLQTWLKNHDISKRAQVLLNDSNKYEQCYQQLFNYYGNWEGEVFEKTKKESVTKSIPPAIVNKYSKLYLLFDENKPVFIIDDTIVAENNVLENQSYYQFHKNKKMVIFTKLKDNSGEYENSRFIYLDSQCYILIDVSRKSNEFLSLEKNNCGKIDIGDTMILYKLVISDKLKRSSLSDYVKDSNPLELIGGIRLNRKYEYLHGYGPSISTNLNYLFLSENKKVEYSSQSSPSGKYKIRLDNYPDYEFTIVDKPAQIDSIPTRNKGWNLKYLSIDKDYNLEGLITKEDFVISKSLIREWININLSKKKLEFTNKNILIKALNNSKI